MGRLLRGIRPMRSIRARVTAGATLFVAVILIVAAVIAVPVLGRVLTDSVAESVDQDLDSLESQLEAAPDRAEAVVAGIDDDLLVRLQTRDGTEVVNDEDAAELAGTDGEDATTVTVDDESWLAATEDTDAGTLTVARPMEHVDDTVSATTTLLVVTVPLMVLLVGLVVWVVTGRALRPVERLRRQVDSIGASDLSRRVDAGDDELGALAATMNRMLGRLEQSQAVQRRFVSDASHELRSPLATMRQYAELAVAHPETVPTEELGEVVVAEGERMQDLVEGLLLLARLDEGQRPPTAPVDLDDLVLRDADRLRRSGGGTGAAVEVDTSGVGPGRVEGNDRLLARVVRNLVDNAARHAEGRITLRVRSESTERGQRVQFTVADDGAGVPPEDRERIFDRFTRLDEGRARDAGGSGLGLAIVRDVVEAHGGTVSVGAGDGRGEGAGAAFTVDLPADTRE
ncbi:sensor histidine kinase [Corynebacterium variabile]|uniref:sensor histidine kinase n=1 Tax=Corynebacterium variabile TaxID=1727 RepID=UPI0026476A6F|nr:HAMP domain-containing sensor histidine kinase [Corynebacterium variabile]MDN6478450.1 HAMP domain-containing histidine kinase [Corynebacterium variabile]MDN6677882.1 HAMP domain-containing histidine kinase [Corynebacterium variabile]MDN6845648.1 HAMP domain-containing histidine kinase [Corynebacterium variabile]